MRAPSIQLDRFEKNVRSFVRRGRLLEGVRRVVAAVSGGPDSMALLYVLARLRAAEAAPFEIAVAHLDHGLRADASRADAALVARTAHSLGVPFVVEELDVAAEVARRGGNLEAIARELRYAFLIRAATELAADAIATGHTATDQAETVIMRLARGTGGDGLSGVASRRSLVSDGKTLRLVRPLLGVPRDDVIDYCTRREIAYRIDETNTDIRLARVYVRREITPRLEHLSRRAAANVARAASLGADDRAYFAERVAALYAEWGLPETGEIGLSVEAVSRLPAALRRRVLREGVRRASGNLKRLTFEHVEAVERLLAPGRDGREASLPFGVRARRHGSTLVICAAVEM